MGNFVSNLKLAAEDVRSFKERPRREEFANRLADANGMELRDGDKVMAIHGGKLYPGTIVEAGSDGLEIAYVDVEVMTSRFPYPEKREIVTFEGKMRDYSGLRISEVLRVSEHF